MHPRAKWETLCRGTSEIREVRRDLGTGGIGKIKANDPFAITGNELTSAAVENCSHAGIVKPFSPEEGVLCVDAD